MAWEAKMQLVQAQLNAEAIKRDMEIKATQAERAKKEQKTHDYCLFWIRLVKENEFVKFHGSTYTMD